MQEMGSKDQIWVCWQEPEVDCGKTSQIPYSWVTEVLIGDGRAPGSVLKCRWPKTRRLYTAKVIAPPLFPHHQRHHHDDPTDHRTSSGSSSSSSSRGDGEQFAIDKHSDTWTNQADVNGDGDAENFEGITSAVRKISCTPTADVKGFFLHQNRPASKGSSAAAKSPHSSGVQSLEENADADLSYDNEDHRPPVLVPQVCVPPGYLPRQHSSSPSSEPALANESIHEHSTNNNSNISNNSNNNTFSLQRWFVFQLSSLKSELANNFDQVNHKLAAMDLSIRNIRNRMDRMEGKFDLALLGSPNARGEIGAGVANDTTTCHPHQWTQREASAQAGTTTTTDEPARGGDDDDQPPPLKRHRTDDAPISSANRQWSNEGNEGDDNNTGREWANNSATSVVKHAPSTPKRSARKTIVHRAPPISPPPLLIREESTPNSNNTSREENNSRSRRAQPSPLSPAVATASPTTSRSTAVQQHARASGGGGNQRKRRNTPPIVVKFKPGSNDRIVYLGGDPSFAIGVDIYTEALESVYEDTPIYLLLSLLRRLLSDQDMARLWFKPDPPTQPNFYALSPSFVNALKKQAVMQYPRKTIPEREYTTKLSQATYDAKYRIRHGKGSCSRPRSYFPLDVVAVMLPASTTADVSAKGCSANSRRSVRDSNQKTANSIDYDEGEDKKEDEEDKDFISGPLILLGDADDDVAEEWDNNTNSRHQQETGGECEGSKDGIDGANGSISEEMKVIK